MILNSLEIMAPLLLAALGGLISFSGGILIIGLEGLMLLGAFTGYTAAFLSQSILTGVIFAAVSSMLLAAIFYFFTIPLQANIYIAGLAINLGMMGFIPIMSEFFFNTKGVIDLSVPNASALFSLTPFFYDSLLILLLIYGLLYKTVFGLRIYACGNNSDAATVRGISVNGYRFISILLTGVFCGIAGAFLSLRLGSYVPDITAGRGWIALVAIFLGRKKPLGVAAACFFFALTESFAVRMQDWVDAPGVGTLIWAIPYAVTLAAVVIYRIIQDRVKRS